MPTAAEEQFFSEERIGSARSVAEQNRPHHNTVNNEDKLRVRFAFSVSAQCLYSMDTRYEHC